MADLGWIGREGTDRMIFFAKSKEILRFLHDIRNFITNKTDLNTVEQTAQIITEIGNKLMEQDNLAIDEK